MRACCPAHAHNMHARIRQTIGFAATIQTLLALAAARSLTTAPIPSGGICTNTWHLHSTQMRLLEILIPAVAGGAAPSQRVCPFISIHNGRCPISRAPAHFKATVCMFVCTPARTPPLTRLPVPPTFICTLDLGSRDSNGDMVLD